MLCKRQDSQMNCSQWQLHPGAGVRLKGVVHDCGVKNNIGYLEKRGSEESVYRMVSMITHACCRIMYSHVCMCVYARGCVCVCV